jgi:hypothetical protein
MMERTPPHEVENPATGKLDRRTIRHVGEAEDGEAGSTDKNGTTAAVGERAGGRNRTKWSLFVSNVPVTKH